MGKKGNVGYYLIRTATWFVQLIPLRIHYIHSWFFYLVVYYIVKYRRKTVFKNLKNSFPEKSGDEITQIAKQFYRHLCDTFFEILYFDRISEKEISRRLTILNPELMDQYLFQGRQVILALGHFNNWEWNYGWPQYPEHKGYVIYKRLTNKSFEKFYYRMRSQFGIIPLERADTFRQLVADMQNHQPSVAAFLMDQTPRKNEIQYWTNFLNQDTAILTGTEKMARKLNAVVLFCYIRKLKKGYNRLEFTLITDNPKETQPFEITEKATRMIEEAIIRQPELWLWSHRRWKHRREK